jgi:NAD(P)-dependent dehydrogenase (short-subunit alcohol dehydrogenase family)
MTQHLDSRVALVTGGASGIGRACALALAALGATVVVADLDRAGGNATARQCVEQGGQASFTQTDVTDAASVAQLVAHTVADFGRLDIAVNSAGVAATSRLHECPDELWERVIAVNLRGVFLSMKHELAQMLTARAGVIVNIASIAGVAGIPELGAYAASKHGVLGLTKTAALEYAADGIRVNAVCPGYIRTPMTGVLDDYDPAVEARLGPLHPVGRMGTPAEVASMVAYLCSAAAAFVTGAALLVDGGYTAR